jgi:hypothetical protein
MLIDKKKNGVCRGNIGTFLPNNNNNSIKHVVTEKKIFDVSAY